MQTGLTQYLKSIESTLAHLLFHFGAFFSLQFVKKASLDSYPGTEVDDVNEKRYCQSASDWSII